MNGEIKSKGVLIGEIGKLNTIHGYSAYEIAVINGFEGTEQDWLESLKGYALTSQDKEDVAELIIDESLQFEETKDDLNRQIAAERNRINNLIPICTTVYESANSFTGLVEGGTFMADTDKLDRLIVTLNLKRNNSNGYLTQRIEVTKSGHFTEEDYKHLAQPHFSYIGEAFPFGSLEGSVYIKIDIDELFDIAGKEELNILTLRYKIGEEGEWETEGLYITKVEAVNEGYTEVQDFNKIVYNMELKKSLNLANPNEVVSGGYIEVDGKFKSGSSYKHTGYIDVVEGDVLTFFYTTSTGGIGQVTTTRICAYDSNGSTINELGVQKVKSYTVPAGVEKVIISVSATYNGLIILKNYDGTPTEYIDYFAPYYVATEGFISDVCYTKEESDIKNAKTEKVAEDVDIIKEAMEIDMCSNLCNPAEIKEGFMDTTGNPNTNSASSYRYTGYIDVAKGDVLTFFRVGETGGVAEAEVTRIAAYDVDGNAVVDSGVGNVKGVYSYAVPEGIVRVIVSFGSDYFTYGYPMILKNYDGTPAEPIEYYAPRYVATKDFVEDVCYTEDEVDAMFTELEYGNIKEDYILDEIERVKAETIANDGVLNFIFQSDQHIDARNKEIHQIHEVVNVADIGQFDFICMGGDITQAGDSSWYPEKDKTTGAIIGEGIFVDKKPMVLEQYNKISKITNKAKCPTFYCLGNHDVGFGAYNGVKNLKAYCKANDVSDEMKALANELDADAQSILPKEFFRIFNNKLGESVVWDSENPQGGYFYKDFTRSRIRVIVLQTQDVFKEDGSVVDTVGDTSLNPRIQQKQFSWFCNKALNFMDKGEDRKNWGIVVLSHANVFLGASSGGSISHEQSVVMRGVLNAFMTGGTYTGTTPEGFLFELKADVDFKEQGGIDFICSVNGHVHADTVMYLNEIIENCNINRPCIQLSASNGVSILKKDYSASPLKEYFILPDRKEGTITTEAFDIFSIDRNNRKIKTIRFGAGENREIDY